MAEKPHGFSGKDAKRIGRATKYVEGMIRGNTGPVGAGTSKARIKVWGKLTTTMDPGGTGEMELWTVDIESGGLGESTGETLPIVDADKIPLDVTLAIGTVVDAIFGWGGWILDGYRCQS